MKKYNRKWNTDDLLQVELACFKMGLSVEDGGLGKAEHFWNVIAILWPKTSRKHLIRNPWSDKMVTEACRHQFLSVSGPASASKSETFASWAIVNYLAAPLETIVLVTSTSLKDSRKRIWGSITDLWMSSAVPLWGKLVDSIGMIRAEFNGVKGSDRCGIALITGEKRKEKDSIGKLVGIKNDNVILIGDELPELSAALIEAAVSNLQSNPHFQFVGIGNPSSRYDPHGQFSEPEAGWKSVSDADVEWKTKLGYAIRFDAELSPNVLADKVIYSFLPSKDKLAKAKKELGENSLSFWRMWRGFWCPEGAKEGVYDESQIVSLGGDETFVRWIGTPLTLAGFDPAFVNGGDECRLQFGMFGTVVEGPPTLLFTESVLISEDITLPVPRNQQIVNQVVNLCMEKGVKCADFGMDTTGGGSVFAEVLAQSWENTFHKVQFGGNATDKLILLNDSTTGRDLYADRVSELWGVGAMYLKGRQLKGIRGDLAAQMCARRQTTVKTSHGVLLAVESKKLMKKRTGSSPDIADAAFILLDLLRERYGFRVESLQRFDARAKTQWKEMVSRCKSGNRMASVGTKPQLAASPNSARRLGGPQAVPVRIIGGGWGNVAIIR